MRGWAGGGRVLGLAGRFSSRRAGCGHCSRHDVEFEALRAFFMLADRRRIAPILDEQLDITRQLAAVARSHYATGHGTEAEVLRLDTTLVVPPRGVILVTYLNSERRFDVRVPR